MVKGNLLKRQPRGLGGNFTYGLDGVLRRGLLSVEWIVIIYNWQNLGEQRSWNFMIYQTYKKYFGPLKTLDLVKPQSRRNIYDRPWLIKRPLVVPMSSRNSQTRFFTKTLPNTSTKKRDNSFFNSFKYILIPNLLFSNLFQNTRELYLFL